MMGLIALKRKMKMKMNRSFEEITKDYIERYDQYKTDEAKIDGRIKQRRSQILRLERKGENLYLRIPFWTEDLLRPLWVQVIDKLSSIMDFKDEYTFNPMGMCARVSLFPKYKGKTLMVCFVPGDINKGELRYETGKTDDGRKFSDEGNNPNGFGRTSEPVTSVDQIVNFLVRQTVEDVYGNEES